MYQNKEVRPMRVIKADVEACRGYANCVVAAADIFDIGDDGTVVILDDSVIERDEKRVVTAIRSCPVSALHLEMP
ncbi:MULTISPECIES: ferredoxin [Mycobacteriaceae]|uniref:ferredoxin n=1 Tax=Mycobacteriaceae TaxID=1762 RepID=UPI00350FC007